MCKSPEYICAILPPHVLTKMTESNRHRERALRTIALTERARGRRSILGTMLGSVPTGTLRRTIYDAQASERLPGTFVRGEGDAETRDVAVTEAYKYSGNVYNFYKQIFARNSVDNNGLRLDSTVHYSQQYDNAFWDGRQMIYGDGDGELFNRFTLDLDVIGHELTHGVTQNTAGLEYAGQSGALNESMSDVFGTMVKQWVLRSDSTVHYSQQYDNAFWDGRQMIYGDGDGELFNRFTLDLDVIGHELTHGVTQNTAGLEYAGQSGALNESMSDVFGTMVKQWVL